MSEPSDGSSTKKENVAKATKPVWVAPSFGSFDKAPPEPSPSFKRPTAKRQRRRSPDETLSRSLHTNVTRPSVPLVLARLSSKMTWVEKYTPQARTDLAVHPRKVDDVYDWLKHALKSSNKAPMLVLTGPPGTGKTAAMRVAAKEMQFLLREWITPINNNLYTEDEEGKKRFDRGYVSEYDLVKDFLMRTSRYPSVLQGEQQAQQSVVLVEDLPLTFYRDPGAFHDLLWEYSEDGRSPLVLIVGDNRVYRKLFPDIVISRLKIKVIDFNPVALTIMTRMLQNIVQQEQQNVANKTFQGPPRDVIDSIYESSCGDLRSAINTLQFACLRGAQNISKAVSGKVLVSPKKTAAKKSRPAVLPGGEKLTEMASIGGRDAPEDFFRVIGRVLYAKREKGEDPGDRGTLVHRPQDIVSSIAGSAEFFTGFLHENYLAHFPTLKSLEKAAQYFCHADTIMNPFDMNERGLAKQLGLSVAVQGLMYCKPDAALAPRLGFRPHHKPRSFAAAKAYEDSREQARLLFPNSHCSSYELLTELVPYIGHIGGTATSSEAQLKFIESTRLEKSWAPTPLRSVALTSQLQSVLSLSNPDNGQRFRPCDDAEEATLEDDLKIEDIVSD